MENKNVFVVLTYWYNKDSKIDFLPTQVCENRFKAINWQKYIVQTLVEKLKDNSFTVLDEEQEYPGLFNPVWAKPVFALRRIHGKDYDTMKINRVLFKENVGLVEETVYVIDIQSAGFLPEVV